MSNQKRIILLAALLLFFVVLTSNAAAEAPPTGQSGPGKSDVPGGQTKVKKVSGEEGISGDIFGEKAGRFHPFIVVQGVYTDNLFATHENEQDDFITTVAPGIWIAVPANREKIISLSTTTTASGGLQLSRIKPEASRRWQTYFLYSPEFVFYADHSHHDHVNHKAEAAFQYNFDSGFSIDLINLFNDKEQIAGNGVTDLLYRHKDNLFNALFTYETRSEKFKFQFDYANYDLNYEDDIVEYRNRNDNAFGAAVYYKFRPKTSLFLEYNLALIEFDENDISDNTEHRYFGGIAWDITAKTKGKLKLGYTDKDFDSSLIEDQDDFSVEIQTQHNLTPKRALQVNGYRRFHESDQAGASSFLSTGIDIGLLQRFTEKWSGTLNAFYEINDYNEVNREDDYYGISPALRFKPKKWLYFDLGYSYYNNDSNVLIYNYEVNQFMIRATVSM